MVADGILAKRNVACALHHDVLQTINTGRGRRQVRPTNLQLQKGEVGRRQRHGPVGEIGSRSGSATRIVAENEVVGPARSPGTNIAGDADVDVLGSVAKTGGEHDRIDRAAIGATIATDIDVGQQRLETLVDAAQLDAQQPSLRCPQSAGQ